MLFIRLITLLALVAGVSSVRVIGWWVGSINDPTFPIEQFPWEMYTHFRHGQPITFENGTAYCNKTDYAFQRILKKRTITMSKFNGLPAFKICTIFSGIHRNPICATII